MSSAFLRTTSKLALRPSLSHGLLRPLVLLPCRSYALSRHLGPRSRIGSSTTTSPKPAAGKRTDPSTQEILPTESADTVWDASHLQEMKETPLPGSGDAEGGLQALLQNDTLIVVRQLEMMNVFLGFEQANRYAIMDPLGNNVGYMAEEERGFFGTVARQMFRTHRAFRAVIMDAAGTPILWIHRPFSFINSRIYIQRKVIDPETGVDEKAVVLGEAQQEWHPWRRRYNVFTGRDGDFEQFARIDAPFLSWQFHLQDASGSIIGSIIKNFTGFGREIFTDTSQFALTFRPDTALSPLSDEDKPDVYRRLTLEERASVLALALTIDIDYFSRHSEGGVGLPLFGAWTMGGGE